LRSRERHGRDCGCQQDHRWREGSTGRGRAPRQASNPSSAACTSAGRVSGS
jgi:hypothetical protein